MLVFQLMMLVSTCEKAEGMERMERALRHDPATLVELQNAIFTRARPSTRPRGNKRRGRYENKVDAQGQTLKGMKKYKLDHTASMYWTDYLSLKDAAYYDGHPDEDRTLREKFEAAIRMPLSLFQRLASEMAASIGSLLSEANPACHSYARPERRFENPGRSRRRRPRWRPLMSEREQREEERKSLTAIWGDLTSHNSKHLIQQL